MDLISGPLGMQSVFHFNRTFNISSFDLFWMFIRALGRWCLGVFRAFVKVFMFVCFRYFNVVFRCGFISSLHLGTVVGGAI